MSPVPTSTMYPGGENANVTSNQSSTVPPPLDDTAPPPPGGVQALPSEALDFAAKVNEQTVARQS